MRDDALSYSPYGIPDAAGIRVSLDGRGRFFDNIFVERLWRTVKYENLDLNEYPTVPALKAGLGDYFHFYNFERPHQALACRVPASVYGVVVDVPILVPV